MTQKKKINLKPLSKKQMDKHIVKAKETHKVWHKFSNWLTKKYGQDLWGKWQRNVIKNAETGKKSVFRYRNFNDWELSKRLVGYEVMCDVEKFIKRACPEIKIIRCDDEHHAGAFLLLVPHPKMGITVLYIPQCTSIQNQFFLYDNHCKMLVKGLAEMNYVYKNKLG